MPTRRRWPVTPLRLENGGPCQPNSTASKTTEGLIIFDRQKTIPLTRLYSTTPKLIETRFSDLWKKTRPAQHFVLFQPYYFNQKNSYRFQPNSNQQRLTNTKWPTWIITLNINSESIQQNNFRITSQNQTQFHISFFFPGCRFSHSAKWYKSLWRGF